MAIYNHQMIDIHKQISAAMSAAYVDNNFSEPSMTFRELRKAERYVLSHIDEDQRPQPWRWS